LNLWFRVEKIVEEFKTHGNALERQKIISTYEAEEILLGEENPFWILTETKL